MWFSHFLEAEQDRFVLWLPVAQATGTGVYFTCFREPSALEVLALLAAGLGLAGVLWRRGAWRGAGLGAAAFALGFALAAWATWRAPPMPELPRQAVSVEGRVADVEALPEGWRVMLEAPRLAGGPALARRVRVRLREGEPPPAVGEVVRVRALLAAPAPPAWPGGWDRQRDAFFSRVAGSGFALGAMERVAPGPAGLGAGLRALRAGVAARVQAALPGPAGAIAATLLAGRNTGLTQGDRDAFAASGLAHLLAVAGLHVGVVMGLGFAGIHAGLALSETAALRLPVAAISAVGALALGVGYLLLTGGHLPILRSVAMAALVTLGVATGRRPVSLRGLSLAAVLLLAAAPVDLLSAGFQLSFSAVLALIAGYEALRPWLARVPGRVAPFVVGLALTSVLAGTASAPFVAYHFGSFSAWYVPANLVAVPITAFWVMPWGLVSLALMPLGLERWSLAPMGWGIGAVRAVAHAVAGWPGASLPVPAFPVAVLVLTGLGLAWLGVFRSRVRLLGVPVLAVAALVAVLAPRPDVLLTPEGRVLALRAGGRVWAESAAGAAASAEEAPGRLWGVASVSGLPWQGEVSGLACRPERCRVTLPGGVLVVSRKREEDEAACPGVALVASTAWLPAACPDTPALGRRQAARDGAITVRLRGGTAELVSDRAVRGDRPWVLLPRLLPAAATE